MKSKLALLLASMEAKFRTSVQQSVFFSSFGGMYNDNPKYVSESLHRRRPDVDIIWGVADRGKTAPPDYVRCIPFGSRQFFRCLKESAVVVDNYTGLASLGFFGNRGRRLMEWLAHSPRQLCICTWHGSPLKKIGRDILSWSPAGYATSATYCIAGCRYTAQCLERAYFLDGKIRLYGTPRNDILFQNPDKSAIADKLHLPNKRLVLYAPTFRDDVVWSGLEQVKQMDIPQLLKALEQRFGGEFAFVFRVHAGVLGKVKTDGILTFDGTRVVDGNLGDDMAEYLACADVLITDYSGSLFDFALTGKPCFLFAPDREHYEKVERGFYMRYEDLPYPIAESFVELTKHIAAYDTLETDGKRKAFLAKIGNVEDGHAADRIVDDIISFLD